jgi:hypothetical protein
MIFLKRLITIYSDQSIPPFYKILMFIIVRYEGLRAVIVKNSIFWDKTPCSVLKVKKLFGGKCRLHLQSRRISKERNQLEAGSKEIEQDLLVTCFMLVTFLAYSSTLKIQATYKHTSKLLYYICNGNSC